MPQSPCDQSVPRLLALPAQHPDWVGHGAGSGVPLPESHARGGSGSAPPPRRTCAYGGRNGPRTRLLTRTKWEYRLGCSLFCKSQPRLPSGWHGVSASTTRTLSLGRSRRPVATCAPTAQLRAIRQGVYACSPRDRALLLAACINRKCAFVSFGCTPCLRKYSRFRADSAVSSIMLYRTSVLPLAAAAASAGRARSARLARHHAERLCLRMSPRGAAFVS